MYDSFFAMAGHRESLIVFTLFGVLFLTTADSQLLIPLLPTMSKSLHASIASLGWLFSVYALAAALFSLLLGPLTDHWGKVKFLRAGLLLFAVLTLGTYRADNYRELFWLRAATGLAAGLISTCAASFVGDFFPYARRGRVMGIVLSSYFAALVLGIPLGAWIAERWRWQAVFFASSLLALTLLVMSVWFVPVDSSSRLFQLRTYFRSYPEFLRRRETRAALAVSFSVSGATLAFLTFISGYLSWKFGLTPLHISWLFLIAGLTAMVGSPLSGWMSDRWTKRAVFLASNTLLILPFMTLNRFAWGTSLLALFFVIGLCIAFRQTALHTVQTELVALEQRGSFLALRNGFSQLGISVCVFVAGTLYSGMGYGAVMSWAAVLTLLGSAIFYWSIQEPKR